MMDGTSIQLSPTWVLLVMALGMLPLILMSSAGWMAMENSPTGVSCSTIFTDGLYTILNANYRKIVFFFCAKSMIDALSFLNAVID